MSFLSSSSSSSSSSASSGMSVSWSTWRQQHVYSLIVFGSSVILLLYITMCARLRFRRVEQMLRRYQYVTTPSCVSTDTDEKKRPAAAGRSPLKDMSVQDAHEILETMSQLEFPTVYGKALQLALFSTYGIPSITKLLTATNQLSSNSYVGKRYADTSVIMAEIYENAPGSQRRIESLSRLNYLHGHYIRQGKISNDDMLFTLFIIMTLPVEWIDRYEWRKVTELERCAVGVYYLALGQAMDISFDPLVSSADGWRDGVHFYEEADAWLKAYIARAMVPDSKNFQTARPTRDILLAEVPKFLHGPGEKMISAVMFMTLREAIMFKDPGMVAPKVFETIMSVRKWFVRYLALPRSTRKKLVIDEPATDGRRRLAYFDAEPHYVRPTLWNRYGPFTWWRRLMGLPLPGDKSMLANGFSMNEVGPRVFEGKGKAEAQAIGEKLSREHVAGCPFGIGR